MAVILSNPYTTIARLKAHLDIDDTASDGELIAVVNAVSRAIERYTGTRFYASTETRTYTPLYPDRLDIDDLLSVTTLKTDDDADGTFETTWAATDFKLYPRNATADGEPYRYIKITPYGNYVFPHIEDSVQIAGSFGYNSGNSLNAPAAIQQACLLACARLWKRKDTIVRQGANAALGTTTTADNILGDPDIQALLDSVAVRPIFNLRASL